MMDRDKELLELAAKAAGISIAWIGSVPWYAGQNGDRVYWEPLTDDGDALRLAITLDLLDEHPDFTYKLAENRSHTNDKFAATRHAIVQAAAEIGKAMP